MFVIDALFLEKTNSNNTRAHKKGTADIKKREREKKRLGIRFLDSKKWNLDIYFQMVFDV